MAVSVSSERHRDKQSLMLRARFWRWLGVATGCSRQGSNPAAVTSLRNFGNSVYPALPVSFGGDTKSSRSLLSGAYARGSKRSHQSTLECVTVMDSTTHSKKTLTSRSAIVHQKTLPCTSIGRTRNRKCNAKWAIAVCRTSNFFMI